MANKLYEIDSAGIEEINQVSTEVKALEVNTWKETVQFTAKSVFLDGIPIADIYPVCVDQVSESYDLEALEDTIDEDIEDLLSDFTSVKSFDACMLQYPPENQ